VSASFLLLTRPMSPRPCAAARARAEAADEPKDQRRRDDEAHAGRTGQGEGLPHAVEACGAQSKTSMTSANFVVPRFLSYFVIGIVSSCQCHIC